MSIRGIVDRVRSMAGPVGISHVCVHPDSARRLFFCKECCAYTSRQHTCGGDTVTCLGCGNKFDNGNDSFTRHLQHLKIPPRAKAE